MKRRQHEEDEDPFDEGLLKDGQSVRIPLYMKDSLSPLQQAVALSSLSVVDGQGGVTGLHRPGFRLDARDARKIERQTSDAMRARDAAYRDYEIELVNAYKTPMGFGGDPSITSFGVRGSVSQREGGTGMLDYEANAEDVVRNAATHTESACRRDHRTVAQMMRDHQNKMADIYEKFDHELSEKWRGL
jgi:hypothetical protein